MINKLFNCLKNRLNNFILGDKFYLCNDVPLAKNIAHDKWQDYLIDLANKNHWRVLEIGSREVTGVSSMRKSLFDAEYVGFDFYSGNNVDIIGDVHKLSSYFNGEKFDLIFTSACFEHFAMPWIASQEIVKLLKVGGYIFVETHYSYSSHERPWHYFQFSENALEVLFNREMGIECLEKGVSNPLIAKFSKYAVKYLRGRKIPGLYCHSEFLGKKFKDVDDFNWYNVNVEDIYRGTKYIEPNKSN